MQGVRAHGEAPDEAGFAHRMALHRLRQGEEQDEARGEPPPGTHPLRCFAPARDPAPGEPTKREEEHDRHTPLGKPDRSPRGAPEEEFDVVSQGNEGVAERRYLDREGKRPREEEEEGGPEADPRHAIRQLFDGRPGLRRREAGPEFGACAATHADDPGAHPDENQNAEVAEPPLDKREARLNHSFMPGKGTMGDHPRLRGRASTGTRLRPLALPAEGRRTRPGTPTRRACCEARPRVARPAPYKVPLSEAVHLTGRPAAVGSGAPRAATSTPLPPPPHPCMDAGTAIEAPSSVVASPPGVAS